MLGYDAWRIPSAAYLAVARALLAAKFAELRLRELRRTPSMRSSQNSFKANFLESPKGEVRRILILDTSVNKTFVRDAPGVLRWHHGGRRKGFGPVSQGLKKEEEGIVCPPT